MQVKEIENVAKEELLDEKETRAKEALKSKLKEIEKAEKLTSKLKEDYKELLEKIIADLPE